MKKLLSILLTCLLLFGSLPMAALAEERAQPAITGDYVEGQAIVGVQGGLQNLTGSQRSRGAAGFQVVESLMTVSDGAAENSVLRSRAAAPEDSQEIVLVQSNTGEGTQALIESLKANPAVLFAEPNYRVQVDEDEADLTSEPETTAPATPSAEAPKATVQPETTAEPQAPEATVKPETPQDNTLEPAAETATVPEAIKVQANTNPAVPDMSNGLWSMVNKGQMGGTAGIDINTKPVWDAGNKGSENVAVAVLDTGIDYKHEDLKGQMWDEKETGISLDGIDGGGPYGKNVCTTDSTPLDSKDPMDNMLHGTHCAGTIGASWDGKGVYGVSGDLQLIAVKGMNATGGGLLSDLIKGYDYLSAVCDALNGKSTQLKAVNNSWSLSNYSEALNTAITTLGQKGVVSVFAAGNSNTNLDQESNTTNGRLPKAYTLVVGAMNSDGTKAVFSSYGKQSVDVFAPGSSILSTIPTDMAVYMAPFADESANYIYDGYEGSQAGETDKVAQNGGLPLYYYSDSAAKHVGDAVDKDETGKAMLGNGCLKTNETTEDGLTLISQPITLNTGDNAPDAYFSFGAQNTTSSTSKITVTYVGADGTETPCPVVDKVTQVDKVYGAMRRYNLWEYSTVALPENFAAQSFQLKLEIKIEEGHPATGLYIDAVGIGTQKVAYGYEHGTSMATPAVTGSVALLAAKYPGESADVLATRVKGGTTPSEYFKDNSISGGYINVEKAQNNPNPVVYGAEQQDSTVTLKGHFLGDTKGAITVDGQDVTAAVTSWNADAITLNLDKAAVDKGRHAVDITAGSNTGSSNVYFGADKKTAQGFETLSLPEGDSLNTMTERNTASGALAAVGGSLYYFNGSYVSGASGSDSTNPDSFLTKVWRYTPNDAGGSWEQLASPEALFVYDPTACAWQGKVYLMGADMASDPTNPNFPTKLFSLDTATGSWSVVCELSGLPNRGTLINYKDQLIYAGGANADGTMADTCYQINPEGKTAELTDIRLPKAMAAPRIAVGGAERDTITVCDNLGTFYTTGDHGKTWQEATADFDGKGQTVLAALGGTTAGAVTTGLTASYKDPEAFRDTWTLDKGADKLIASDKVYYPVQTVAPVGIAYQNHFYVLSRVPKDTEANGIVFKRMAVGTTDASEVKPGGGGDKPNDGGNNAGGGAKASVNTGVIGDNSLSAAVCALLLAAALTGGMIYRKKQNHKER